MFFSPKCFFLEFFLHVLLLATLPQVLSPSSILSKRTCADARLHRTLCVGASMTKLIQSVPMSAKQKMATSKEASAAGVDVLALAKSNPKKTGGGGSKKHHRNWFFK